MRLFKLTLAILLTSLLVAFVFRTLHWPLVSDAALIRYTTFLLDHGFAPYRQIQDYNLPGAYLADWLVVHVLGPGDLAFRAFDLLLLASAALAMWFIVRRFAALFAFALFALVHARDGIAHTGQRDLTMTILILAATASLLRATRRLNLNLILFGLLLGAAATLKPLALLLLPASLLLLIQEPQDTPEEPQHLTSLVCLPALAALLPIAAALLWIAHHNALAAFRFTLFHLIPFHAALGYPGLAYLLTRCLTVANGTLLALAVILALTSQESHRRTRLLLLAGLLFGLLSFVAQGKGYPYQRYPFTAFLFLFAASEFTRALDGPTRAIHRPLAIAGLVFGTVLAVLYTTHALRERWPAQPYTAMAADLRRLDTPASPLSGNVQCIDTISGCIATLNTLHLLPATGLFYDEFLFAPQTSLTRAQSDTETQVRSSFLAALERRPPDVLLITSFLFPRGPDDYAKLRAWPGFASLLSTCYSLVSDRSFAVPPPDPTRGYRIYLRRPGCSVHDVLVN